MPEHRVWLCSDCKRVDGSVYNCYNEYVYTPVPSTSIRIDEQALAVLRELARKERQPSQTVLKEANVAFAALRSNPQAWGEEQQERDLWDRTSVDGLERE